MKIKINNQNFEITEKMIKKSLLIKTMINNNFKKEKYEIDILDKKGNLINLEYIEIVIKYMNNENKNIFNPNNILECYHISKIMIIEDLTKELLEIICIIM